MKETCKQKQHQLFVFGESAEEVCSSMENVCPHSRSHLPWSRIMTQQCSKSQIRNLHWSRRQHPTIPLCTSKTQCEPCLDHFSELCCWRW
jgi:hypothetical protein